MKKFLIMLSFLLALASPVFAETGPNRNITNIVSTTDSATFTIPGAALECSEVFSTKFVNTDSDNINFWIQATSASGTPNLTYSFEESIQKTTTATSGTIDSAYLITEQMYAASTSENMLIGTIETVNGTYGRIRIQGESANPGDTTVTIKMVK